MDSNVLYWFCFVLDFDVNGNDDRVMRLTKEYMGSDLIFCHGIPTISFGKGH